MCAKILIVEDQRDILELLAGNLSARGYEVHTAHTGLDALDLARRCLPDLIVLDLLLEDLDGLSVCAILRTQPSTARTPVLAMTALGGELAGRNALDHGVDAVLSKPVCPQELLRQVESVLQSRVATRHEPSSPDEKAV